MNKNMQRYNTFRNRWVGAYLTNKGIRVVPTISWGLENTFDFCFNGIEKGSTVAVSTSIINYIWIFCNFMILSYCKFYLRIVQYNY